MKIVFYSTNSNTFDKETYKIDVMASNESQFLSFKAAHPQHQFICVTQAPGLFMPEKSAIVLDGSLTAQQVAGEIKKLQPDLALAMSFWVTPYDWLPINDSLVAEELEKAGVRTIAHPVESSLICFDKWRTHQKLLQEGFKIAPAVFVDHDLYFCAGSHKEVVTNVYRASIRSQLEKLHLPLIIKDVASLSSYGMTVVHSYGEAVGYLNSKRNNSNRLVEEYLEGEQYGLEVYGLPGNYNVLPPMRFSLNQYGITSPKQSAKFGPFELNKELRSLVVKLAECLQIKGAAQVDLIKVKADCESGNSGAGKSASEGGKTSANANSGSCRENSGTCETGSDSPWRIIEINPRLSGMSFSYATGLGLSVFEMLWRTCICKLIGESGTPEGQEALPPMKTTLSLKLPIVNLAEMEKILAIPGVRLLNQTNDTLAKQEREKGFCECIITGENAADVEKAVDQLKALFPGEATIQQSETILKWQDCPGRRFLQP